MERFVNIDNYKHRFATRHLARIRVMQALYALYTSEQFSDTISRDFASEVWSNVWNKQTLLQDTNFIFGLDMVAAKTLFKQDSLPEISYLYFSITTKGGVFQFSPHGKPLIYWLSYDALEPEQKAEKTRYRYFRYAADQIQKEIKLVPKKHQKISIPTQELCQLLHPVYKRFLNHATKEYPEIESLEEVLFDISAVGELENKILLLELIQAISKTGKSLNEINREWIQKSAQPTDLNQADFLFMSQMYQTIPTKRQQFDDIILRLANNWDLDRIAKIDRILLYMAFYEMLDCPDIPRKVTIQEYIDIANEYSTPKSAQFVNGILDASWKMLSQEGKIHKFGLGLIEF